MDSEATQTRIKVVCPYCNWKAHFLSSKEFYGKDYGNNIYVCYACNAYVGTHGRGRRPLGRLAKPVTRALRRYVHSLFDPLWKSKRMSRNEAYIWLQEVMDLPPEEAHIGMFSEDQCRKLIDILK